MWVQLKFTARDRLVLLGNEWRTVQQAKNGVWNLFPFFSNFSNIGSYLHYIRLLIYACCWLLWWKSKCPAVVLKKLVQKLDTAVSHSILFSLLQHGVHLIFLKLFSAFKHLYIIEIFIFVNDFNSEFSEKKNSFTHVGSIECVYLC